MQSAVLGSGQSQIWVETGKRTSWEHSCQERLESLGGWKSGHDLARREKGLSSLLAPSGVLCPGPPAEEGCRALGMDLEESH